MRKLRLLFLLGVLMAIGATPAAMGQDRNTGLDEMSQSKDRIANQPKANTADQDKISDKKEAKQDDGHRKHWWSPPHRHKKQDKNAKADIKAKDAKNSKDKAVAATPSNNKKSKHQVAAGKSTSHPASTKSANKSGVKSAHARAGKAVHTKTSNKNAEVKKTGNKTVASTGHSRKSVAANKASKKSVASASHSKKTAHPDCSANNSKKGGCQAVKAHGQKTTKATTKVS